jgi:glutamate--cysteine ligase
MIGLELELFPLIAEPSGFRKAADIANERMEGTYDLLYANSLCRCSMFDPDKKLEVPRLNSAAGGIVTFEPGGQIEYSSSAGADLKKVINELIVHMSELETILAARQIGFFFGGLNPWLSAAEVGLKMKKPRYLAMDRYFQNIGPHGQQMMRLSGSIQVSLDFGNEETAEKRWWVANLISPIFCAIFGNSPFLAGKNTGSKSYRSVIWQLLDNSRTGFPHIRVRSDKKRLPFEYYLEFALNANLFTLPDESGCHGYCDKQISFREWLKNGYQGFYPTIEDWDTHLTTLFPEVRAKGFMECRFIDGQSKPCWAVPAIIATALIYDDEATERTLSVLMRYRDQLDILAGEAAQKGVSAFSDLCTELFSLALNTRHYPIDSELLAYCERFYRHYTHRLRNPADDLFEINNGAIFTAEQYTSYESRLFDIIQPPPYLATENAADLALKCQCR